MKGLQNSLQTANQALEDENSAATLQRAVAAEAEAKVETLTSQVKDLQWLWKLCF